MPLEYNQFKKGEQNSKSKILRNEEIISVAKTRFFVGILAQVFV